VDLAFLTEMSNLSPPIIHPPPSYFRTAPSPVTGQFSFGPPPRWLTLAVRAVALRQFTTHQLAMQSAQDQTVDQIGKLAEVPAFLRNVDKRRVSVHHAIAEPPGVWVFRV